VTSKLGPDGLAVYNIHTSDPFTIHNLNGAGEITWWSTSNPYVTATGTGTITMPFSNNAMFPPKGQNPTGNDATSDPTNSHRHSSSHYHVSPDREPRAGWKYLCSWLPVSLDPQLFFWFDVDKNLGYLRQCSKNLVFDLVR
jgi:hypothetical protein